MAFRLLAKQASFLAKPSASTHFSPARFRASPLWLRYATNGTPGQGNPSIVNSLPDTANEVQVSEEVAQKAGGAAPSPIPPINEAQNSYSGDENKTDWSRSYSGLSVQPFSKEAAEVLQAPLNPIDIEIKPEGLIYLPEIKYRRILNKAFGPGGWGLAPRSETNVGPKVVSREYALVCLGRLVAVSRGEQEYFDPSGIATATEACKSNALMRCCKDLGVASELWDPRFIREFKSKYCVEVFAENATTKRKYKLWRRRDQPKFEYPWKE
ncbi:mitochondrial genome maintenance MGM101 [Fomitiporia mediterranea MF3/22]|uniref:mitochondrial genome maintenance MGM101 n=1 Tax=Fomitiporia mediterranea (strain MF3/22) TaxID=694068 RepID=UPI00044092C0|nr:mitochondrial genome maintenance MGM101 [Fomitiporia mediterranea MF3/22]EJD01365.1 mitochondrial genome maintenance MGM101 [Fomitiporia mediterranea MF3/22]